MHHGTVLALQQKKMSVTYMIGPLTSDDRCISIPIVVALAQLDSCGVFGVGGAGI